MLLEEIGQDKDIKRIKCQEVIIKKIKAYAHDAVLTSQENEGISKVINKLRKYGEVIGIKINMEKNYHDAALTSQENEGTSKVINNLRKYGEVIGYKINMEKNNYNDENFWNQRKRKYSEESISLTQGQHHKLCTKQSFLNPLTNFSKT